MMADGCFFLVVGSDARREVIDARAEALARFYAPLMDRPHEVRTFAGDGFLCGYVQMVEGAAGHEREGFGGWWLEPPPAALAATPDLLEASDVDLRRLATGLIYGASRDRCRLATGPTGPTSLYQAQGPGVAVWSTHAIAAGYLARGTVEIATECIPELAALGFVPNRCLVKGVEPVAPATRIDVIRGVAESIDYWPAAKRLEPISEAHAYSHVRDALLDSLEQRLARQARPWLGITAGLDSSVVAAAARQREVDLRTFTWGHDAEDAEGGQRAAETLGLPHEVLMPEAPSFDRGVAQALELVRWTEGMAPAAPTGVPPWPDGMTSLVTGGGGEVGRAYWWRHHQASYDTPTGAQLQKIFRPDLRFPFLPKSARSQIRTAAAEMVEAASDAGLVGWQVLDGVYAEHRLTGWGRAMIGRPVASTIGPLMHPEVSRGLLSLSPADKARDEFHRRLLAECGLAQPSAPDTQRQGIPKPLRRAASQARQLRLRLLARRMRQSIPIDTQYRHWLVAHVLRSDVVKDAFGTRCAGRMSDALLADSSKLAIQTAVALTGPALLSRALTDLPTKPGSE